MTPEDSVELFKSSCVASRWQKLFGKTIFVHSHPRAMVGFGRYFAMAVLLACGVSAIHNSIGSDEGSGEMLNVSRACDSKCQDCCTELYLGTSEGNVRANCHSQCGGAGGAAFKYCPTCCTKGTKGDCR